MDEKLPPNIEEIEKRLRELEAKRERTKATSKSGKKEIELFPPLPPKPKTLVVEDLPLNTDTSKPEAEDGEKKKHGITERFKSIKEKIKLPKRKLKVDPVLKAQRELGERVNNSVAEMGLDSMLPPEFDRLDDWQKLKVVQDLKRRIVDVVKSDAETQYSEDLKQRTIGEKGVARLMGKVADSIKKGSELRNFEKKVFDEIKNTDEGKKLIDENFKILIEKTRHQEIGLTNRGDPFVFYTEQRDHLYSPEKLGVLQHFNWKANIFANIPYEWGQEKGGKNKKAYEKAKAEYEKARSEVLTLKEKTTGRERAVLEVLGIDSHIQMEQILNTHPEFEKVLSNFNKDKNGIKNIGSGALDLLKGIIGEKGAKRQLFFGGAVARYATLSVFGAIAAPAVGAVIGGLKEKYKAQNTLAERQKGARYGKKDESKEAKNTAQADDLAKRMEDMMRHLETSHTGEEWNKRLDQLRRRVAYTQDKMEKGLVNFGNTKSSLNNQFNLINNLNTALFMSNGSTETTRKDIDERLNKFLSSKSAKIAEAEKEFIYKQALRGAMLGAGFASAGYLARYAGEQFGWWGDQGIKSAGTTSSDEGFMDRANKWLGEMYEKIKSLRTATPETPQPAPASNETFAEMVRKAREGADQMTPPTSTESASTPVQTEEYTYDPAGRRDPFTPLVQDTPPTTPLPSTPIKPNFSELPAESTSSLDTTPDTVESVSPDTESVINPDAIIHKGEGIEHAFRRQIEHNEILAKILGYKGEVSDTKALHEFSGGAAHKLALDKGYVDNAGNEIRVAKADTVAYEITLEEDKVVVDEKTLDGKLVETHRTGDAFEQDKEHYEYGYKKSVPPPQTAEVGVPKNAEEVFKEAQDKAFSKIKFGEVPEKFTPDTTLETPPVSPTVEEIREKVTQGYGESEPGPVNITEEISQNRGLRVETPGTYRGYNNPTHDEYGNLLVYNANGTRILDRIPQGRNIITYGGASRKFFPDISEKDNFILQSYPELLENPFNLTGEKLKAVQEIFEDNTKKIFPGDKIENWQDWKDWSPSNMLDNKKFEDNLEYKPMMDYLHKLRDLTGLKPRSASILHWKAETNEEYIIRALQKAAQIGKLGELK